jgi:hypothetical protein
VPLYRFDWVSGLHRLCDRAGLDLADDEAARQQAITEIRELLGTSVGKRLGRDFRIEVCDESGRVVFTVSCADV